MLRVPQLDDLGYDKIFDRARTQIPRLTDEWTDYNFHDPGITVLQTFAWLTDTLNYYMNATGEPHRLAYLKLLGLEPACSPAACELAVDAPGELHLNRGTRLAAGDVVFELTENLHTEANRLTRICSEVEGSFYDLKPFAGVDGGYARIFTYDKDKAAALYLGFDRPLHGGVRFRVEVDAGRRNAFEGEFHLSKLVWDYYQDGRWREVSSVEDGTCGFLRSGFVSLAFTGETDSLENPLLARGHYIRCRLVENGYDLLPQVGRIDVNIVTAEQTRSYADLAELRYSGEGELFLDRYVREDEELAVAVREENEKEEGYLLWYGGGEEPLCAVREGPRPGEWILVFDEEKFGRVPGEGASILVMTAERVHFEEFDLGKTGGYAGERIPFDVENLYTLRLALCEKRGGRTYLELWEQTGDISRASWDSRAFAYDRDNREIVFGDSLSGMQPDTGLEVRAVVVKTSLLGEGNVREGKLDHFLDQVEEDAVVMNPYPAEGGQSPLSSRQLKEYIGEKLTKVTRAVTAGDYRALVLGTPGLCIHMVNVIPMVEYASLYGLPRRPGAVVVAVKPWSEREERPSLTEAYREQVRKHLEDYRLLTVNIEIVPARYVGVGVHGRIVLTENTAAARQSVLDCLSSLIDFTRTKQFGLSVVYGKVFSRLEMLDCVAKVAQLGFDHLGEGGEKNAHGDIVVNPDSLAYLHETDLEFVQGDNR